MLVLARAEGEEIFIDCPDGKGGYVRGVITLVQITGDHSAKIGFVFPKEIRFLRDDAKPETVKPVGGQQTSKLPSYQPQRTPKKVWPRSD